ncbi:MAG: Gfo/Idh/MocA family oxidoreductase [Pseudomonadota bacterium]
MPDSIGLGLIGTGFMGRCHAIAFRTAAAVFPLSVVPRMEAVADINLAAAEALAGRFGFRRATADWRDLVDDPAIGVIAIASPNKFHTEMALAATEAGKHVYCEKPMALTAADAERMLEAAEAANIVHMVGYNYVANPAVIFARKLIDEGVLGDVIHFRCVNDEDYMADPAVPYSWRCRRDAAGTGTLADLGGHAISLALYLAGPIAGVSAITDTVITKRPVMDSETMARSGKPDPSTGAGKMGQVENEDQAVAMLRFENGAIGSFSSSRVAWGRKNYLAFEINGRNGTLIFDQERLNELRLYTNDGIGDDRNGFRTISMGPEHEPYGAFLPAKGHQIGFNDKKSVEVARLLQAIAGEVDPYPSFKDGLAVEYVLDAIERSSSERRWIEPKRPA